MVLWWCGGVGVLVVIFFPESSHHCIPHLFPTERQHEIKGFMYCLVSDELQWYTLEGKGGKEGRQRQE